MAGKFPSTFMPIRIGAMVSKGANVCTGTCGPEHAGQSTHTQPNFRFTLLLYVAVSDLPVNEWPNDTPFNGGPRTPPVDVIALVAAPTKAGEALLRMIGWN